MSSPEYPRSSGLVERTVQTVKESSIKLQICSEPNSYVVLTDCGRLFRRNRTAINVDKFRCRQLLQQEPDVCRRSFPAEAANPVPIRKSLNFLEEWQSALQILPQPPPSHPAAVAIGVAETDEPEDNHQPERRRGGPKTRSTHFPSISSARRPKNRSLSAGRPYRLIVLFE
ncbi:hypothetical protein DAPPUDRAFT_265393 [Daphnia pulex]|uniref:Uncharacterized protein n=1 Tax=Daphnia pulex TaxID=6669 RepID=E9HTD2_DAPPU|nr:hypothetical protein DAPPUDRAFT_265393 [Daphnia pulex]|eukprot:EFX64997.1 hypothetical protein DAPPUDRAFT_265393 [Daphnia pulex]